MKNMRKRLLAMLLCVVLCVSLLPISVFADGTIDIAEDNSGTIIAASEEENEKGIITAVTEEEKMETAAVARGWKHSTGTNTSGRRDFALIRDDAQLAPMLKGALRAEPADDGYYYFSNFEELLDICDSTYSDTAIAIYSGSGNFSIVEDLVLPDNLQMYVYDYSLIVPEGITLAVDPDAVLVAEDLIVNGTIENYGYIFGELTWDQGAVTYKASLTVNQSGSILNYGVVEWTDDISGLDRIISDGGYVYIGVPIDSEDMLEAMLNTAEYLFDFYFDGYAICNFTIEDSHEFMPGCSFFVRGVDVTIGETGSITLNGDDSGSAYLCVDRKGTLTLAGTLINNGVMAVYHGDEDESVWSFFELADGGNYKGNGMLLVDARTENEIFTSFLFGLDKNYFRVGFDEDYHAWALTLKTNAMRIYGTNRYKTGLAIADQLKELRGGSFDSVVVACGSNFPDALAGSYLATIKGAPILLIDDARADLVSSYIAENMTAGGTIYILGSTAAVSAKAESALSATGGEIKRLEGKNRYLTNIEILKEAGISAKSEILVCVGDNYADSLSASSSGLPIFLVGRTTLTAAQKEYLATLENCTFTIIGSESAVNAVIEKELKAYGPVTRVAGRTRYETSIAVAEHIFEDPDSVVLTVGNNFPDGLSAGPLAYELGAPVVLTLDDKTAAAEAYAAGLTIRNGIAVGGSNVLSNDAVVSIFSLESADEIVEYTR